MAIASCVSPRGAFRAITINSFTSVSLDPPLVLWCIESRASAFADFVAAGSYAISILSAEQQGLSERFASHAPEAIVASEVEIWKTGAPVLKGRLAGFDCEVVDRHRSGDHVILVAHVVQFDSSPGAPLTYFASRYGKGSYAD